jgi:hypothetical protein
MGQLLGYGQGQGAGSEIDRLSRGNQGDCGGCDPLGLYRESWNRTVTYVSSTSFSLDQHRAPVGALQKPLAFQMFKIAPDRRVADLEFLAQLPEAHRRLAAYSFGNHPAAFGGEHVSLSAQRSFFLDG